MLPILLIAGAYLLGWHYALGFVVGGISVGLMMSQ